MQVNGMTITYTDAAGKSATLFAGSNFDLYSQLIATDDRQDEAARINTNAKGAYLQGLIDYAAAAGKLPVPVKPLMIVVSDMGVETHVPFDPPLADPAAITPGTPAPSGTLSTQAGAPSASDLVLIAAAAAHSQALAAIKSDVAAIKVKLGIA